MASVKTPYPATFPAENLAISREDKKLLIVLVYQIHNHLHHHILLLGTALGNHQGECHERVVDYTLAAVCGIENVVLLHEPQEEHGGNTFVTVAERVVFHYEIKQHGGLFLYRRIKVLAAESLVNLSDTALERIILLMGKPPAAAKLFLQCVDDPHGIVVGDAERLLTGRLLNPKRLVVITVEGIKGINIIGNDTEQSRIFSLQHLVLKREGTRHQTHHILQLVVVVEPSPVLAFDEVLLD